MQRTPCSFISMHRSPPTVWPVKQKRKKHSLLYAELSVYHLPKRSDEAMDFSSNLRVKESL